MGGLTASKYTAARGVIVFSVPVDVWPDVDREWEFALADARTETGSRTSRSITVGR